MNLKLYKRKKIRITERVQKLQIVTHQYEISWINETIPWWYIYDFKLDIRKLLIENTYWICGKGCENTSIIWFKIVSL